MRYCTLLLLLMCATAHAQLNKLNRFFYHRGAITDNIGCYFAERPVVNLIPVRKVAENQAVVKFMIPKAKVSSAEARAAIDRINKEGRITHNAPGSQQLNQTQVTPWYKIQVAEVTTPIDGIMFQFSFDPRKVRITYATFNSIQQQPGVVFQLHHLDVLEQLKDHNSAPHRLAKGTRIVIDQGHGGEDSGAVGHFNIREKDIAYQVGAKVAQHLQHAGFTVATTRAHDVFVPLDERTTFANEWGADLFVSIHANSSPRPTTAGIETYFLNLPATVDVYTANHHNMSQQRQTWRDEQSAILAQNVHQLTLNSIHRNYPNVPDLKVKKAISQVLLGTNMPSVLIELGFLSNEQEAIRLNTTTYQDTLARGICDGITQYCAKYA